MARRPNFLEQIIQFWWAFVNYVPFNKCFPPIVYLLNNFHIRNIIKKACESKPNLRFVFRYYAWSISFLTSSAFLPQILSTEANPKHPNANRATASTK